MVTMRSLVLSTLAGLAALAAVAATPGDARAQVGVGMEAGVMPVQWGPHPGWDGPRRHHGPPPDWGHRPPPPHWGHRPPPPPPHWGYRPHRPAYVEPTCWRERRWVETPWGREIRHVRICR
jgi:hypothetical protein